MNILFRQILDNRYLVFIVRLILGGLFISASIGKITNLSEFAGLVVSYNILPQSLALIYGYVVPWVEFCIGCLLVLGLFSRLVSSISLALAFSFIVANIYSFFSCGRGYLRLFWQCDASGTFSIPISRFPDGLPGYHDSVP